jgi:hypothetical protein
MARKKQTLRDALALMDAEETLEGVDIGLFSDLSEADLAEVEGRWPDWPVRLRRRLLTTAGEIAEDDFRVNFDSLARLGLDDPDEEVRVAAVADLWESEDAELIPTFIRMMTHDPAAEVRAEAAKNLGRYVYLGECGELLATRARRVEEALLGVIAGVDDLDVRRRAIESVAYSSRPEIAPIIEAAYGATDPALRASAVYAMGRNLDDRWIPAVVAELSSPQAEMRYEAARAAGELEIKSAVETLARLTVDSARLVQEAAIWSLGQIGGDTARETLLRRRRTADAEMGELIDNALASADLENLGFGLLDFAEEPDEDEGGIVLN